MARNSSGQFNNDDSSTFSFSVNRSVPNVGQKKSSTVVDQLHFFDMSSTMNFSTPKSSLDKSTVSSMSQSNSLKHPLNFHTSPIPNFPPSYCLEITNFSTSMEKQALIETTANFLLEYNIDSKWKPIKYKFKCSFQEGGRFVIRFFQDNSNPVYLVEVQRRYGSLIIFKDLFESLRSRILSLSPMTNKESNRPITSQDFSIKNIQSPTSFNSSLLLPPPPPPLTSSSTTSLSTPSLTTSTSSEILSIQQIKTQFILSLEMLSSSMIDSLEIGIEQLEYFLTKSQSFINISFPQQVILAIKEEEDEEVVIVIEEEEQNQEEQEQQQLILLYKKIEQRLYELITFFWQLKLYITFGKILSTLNLFYNFRTKTMAQSITWKRSLEINQPVIIILDAVSSSLQSKFVCISASLVIQSLVFICPEILIQNKAINKLSLAIARQSQRDSFKIDFPPFEKRLQAVIKQLIVS
jgi:hypothetical protein